MQEGQQGMAAAADDLCPVRHVESEHVAAWQALQDDALCAHQAFVTAARGAASARHRGDQNRADSLTRLAQKQHRRWLEISRRMSTYEF